MGFLLNGKTPSALRMFRNETKYSGTSTSRKFSNIDFFLKLLPLKDDELVMSKM